MIDQPVTPVYESTLTVRVVYPGPSPEEAYALHKALRGALRAAAESLQSHAGQQGVLGVEEQIRVEVVSDEGPNLVFDAEPPP